MTKARDLANSAAAFASVSATELGYVDGVTSAIQTQMDAKAPSSTAVTLTGTQTLTNKTLTNPVISSVINNTLTSTTGDIIYASAANTPARLGIGTTGQVLNVASGVPAWTTIASGSTYVGASVSNSAGQSISDSTETTLTWNTEQWDTDGIHSTATNTERMTVPTGKGGKWRVSGVFRGSTSGAIWEYYLFVNGSYYINGFPQWSHLQGGRGSIVATPDIELNLSAGDYIYVRAYVTQSSSSEFSGQYSRFQFSYIGA